MFKLSFLITVAMIWQCSAFPMDIPEEPKPSLIYSTKYDNVDLKEIIASDRLLKNYVDCLLDKGPCTPDGTELKNNLPDAINNNCAKCSEKQKHGSDEVMHHLIDNKPEWWEELEKKFKSDGSYKNEYLMKKKMEAGETKDKKIYDDTKELKEMAKKH